jgi:uncharacterized protein with NAD-binding domain and iron-sulfur cluster
MSGPRKKIAILGGGPAGIAAAFRLTETPELQSEYEVTVYQMGWRLGGKCASGRDDAGRIQEHGLHILGGCYDHTFQMLRRCYEEWDPPAGTKKWQIWEAFRPHSDVSLQERTPKGKFEPWPLSFPERSGEPGDRTVEPTVWGLLGELLPFIHGQTAMWADGGRSQQDLRVAAGKLPAIFQPFAKTAADFYVGPLEQFAPKLPPLGYANVPIADVENMDYGELIGLAAAEANRMAELEELGGHHFISPEAGVREFLRFALSRYQRGLEACKEKKVRRLLLALRAAIAVAIGLVIDVLPFRDFDVIDDIDLRDWLRGHGAGEDVVNSLVINPGYDYAFAYENGDTNNPQLAAGVGIHAFLRLLLTYRGAIFFEMQAAMGEVVFVPLYDVLHARGVDFKFFHRVDKLNVSTSGSTRLIESVDFGIQMKTKDGFPPYDPLVAIPLPNGETHRCWPSGPRTNQLAREAEFKANPVDLEDSEARGPEETPLTLRHGPDYDILILAIPIGEFPRICSDLITASSKWDAMVQNVKTVGTMALQVWLNKTTGQLGGIQPPTIMTSFAQPLNTWADMSHLARVEGPPQPAQSIAYFCGPLDAAVDGPSRRRRSTRDDPCVRAVDWSENMLQIWPNMRQKLGLAPSEPRLESPDIETTFFRRNDKGADRYVLTLPGSTQYRLAPDQSGFTNLYLAGDWTRSGINIGCLEAAVFSGVQAGEAITSPGGKLHLGSDRGASDIVGKAYEAANELANTGEAAVAAGTDALLTLSDIILGDRRAKR